MISIEKMTFVEFPKCLHDIAKQIGHARGLKTQYKGKPKKYDRGKKNAFVDTIGALGELVFLHFLVESNIDFKMVNMVDNYSRKTEDFVVNKQRIDVKCKWNDHPSFIINKEAHEKGKGLIDYYVIVYIKSQTTAELHKFTWLEVDNWKDKALKYATAKMYIF